MRGVFPWTRLLLGWDWFVGPADSHDGRRRTTKALAEFTKFARGAALGNAAVLLHGYVSLANLYFHFLPGDVARLFPVPTGDSLLLLVKSYAQAQLCVQSLSAIHRRLLRIADADH